MTRLLKSCGLWPVVLVALLPSAGCSIASAERGIDLAGKVAGRVTIRKRGEVKDDRSGVVVYLENVGGSLSTPPATHPQIRQRDLAFNPELTVVVKGTTIDFPNEDRVFHNVFSVSETAKFDLGLYQSGASKSVTFQRPGVVDVYCNIHPQMIAKIKVLDTRYYAVTGPDGEFSINGVPAGEHSVVAWQRFGSDFRAKVGVVAGQAASLEVALEERSKPWWHPRKDGTPYGRYK